MLTKEDENFIIYWKANREREKNIMRQLFTGMPLGLLISIGIIVCLASGWYVRANMEARTELNPYVFAIAAMAISVFTGIFYKRHQWDMKEQRYKELLAKKERTNAQ